MAHERQTLDAVIAARSGAVQAAQRAAGAPGGAEAMRGLAQAEAGLAGAAGRVFPVVGGFPAVNGKQDMDAAPGGLAKTDNRIAIPPQGFHHPLNAVHLTPGATPAD